MKNLVLKYILLFCISFSYSQNSIDSLNVALKNSKNDIDKTQILNAIADQYKSSNPTLMVDFATKALQLSQKIDYKIEEGNAELNLGNAQIILGNYAEALKHFATAQSIFENEPLTNADDNLKIKKGLAKAYGSIGIVFAEQSNYSKGLQLHLKAVKIYEAINDIKKCGQVYNNIGVAYQSTGLDFKALDYFLKAQKSQEKTNDINIGITLTNIANCYLKQKNFSKALEYYTKAKTSIDKNPNTRALGEWYNNMGLYFKENNNPTKAIENWNLSIQTFKNIDDKFGVANTYIFLGQLYLSQKNTVLALANANLALQLAKETQVLEQTVVAEKLLSDCYKQQDKTALPTKKTSEKE
jgi:tetratricopeptide (TPR) repeat protein